MRAICTHIAQKHGLTMDEIRSRSAKPRVSHPRQEACWLMHVAGFSWHQIQGFFGFLDHTTAIKGAAAHQRRAAHA